MTQGSVSTDGSALGSEWLRENEQIRDLLMPLRRLILL